VDFFSVENFERLAEVHLVPFVINLVLAIAVFVVGRWVAKALARAVSRLAARSKIDESLVKFIKDLVYATLLMIVIISALERLGIKTTAAVAVLGAAGLAVGFALQGSLGNFASGVMIMFFKPDKVGDVVSAAGHTGKVEEIKIFNTVMLTPDNQQIIVPNSAITGGSITNITAKHTRRVDLVVGIGYGDDIKQAKDLLVKIVSEHPKVLADPAPQVAVAELADSSVNFVVRPWCNIRPRATDTRASASR